MAAVTAIKAEGLCTVKCLAPGALSPNDIFLAGSQLRVYVGQQAAASGALIAAAVRGVFTFPATTADDWADGDILYWDNSTGKLTDTASTNKIAGKALGAKVASTTTADVQLGT
jgi:predicted RecA/RadA family phage recombinase